MGQIPPELRLPQQFGLFKPRLGKHGAHVRFAVTFSNEIASLLHELDFPSFFFPSEGAIGPDQHKLLEAFIMERPLSKSI